jgi:hypothetical protein
MAPEAAAAPAALEQCRQQCRQWGVMPVQQMLGQWPPSPCRQQAERWLEAPAQRRAPLTQWGVLAGVALVVAFLR